MYLAAALVLIVGAQSWAVPVQFRIETDDRNQLFISSADSINGTQSSGYNGTNTGNIDLTPGTSSYLHIHGREFGGGNWTSARFTAPVGHYFAETGNQWISTNADATKQPGKAVWTAWYDSNGPYDAGGPPSGQGWEDPGYPVWTTPNSSSTPSDMGDAGGNFPTGTRRVWAPSGAPNDQLSVLFSTRATLQAGALPLAGSPTSSVDTNLAGFNAHAVKSSGDLDSIDDGENALTLGPDDSGHFASNTTIIPSAHINGAGYIGGEDGWLIPNSGGNSADGTDTGVRLAGWVHANAGDVRTFAVGTDDGYRLTVGSTLVSERPGGGVPATPDMVQVQFPSTGYWPVEMTYFQGGGGVGMEVHSAPGAQTSFDTTTFTVLGDDPSFPVYQRPGGITLPGSGTGLNTGAPPLVPGGLTPTQLAQSDGLRVQVLTKGSGFANAQEAVDFLKANPDSGAIEYRSVMDFAGASGVFPQNTAFPQDSAWNANNFAMRVNGLIYVQTPGDYAVGVGTDDGFRIRVAGEGPHEYSGGRGIPGNWANYTLVNFPSQGLYPVEFYMYQGGGGYAAEISAGPFGTPGGPGALVVGSRAPDDLGLSPDLTGMVFSVKPIAKLAARAQVTTPKAVAKAYIPALDMYVNPESWKLQEIIHNGQAKQQGLFAQYYDASGAPQWDDSHPAFQNPVWTANQLTGGGTFHFGNNYGYGPGGSEDDLENNFGARWTGFLDVPQTGEYSFHMNSDDDSWIFIDVDNDGVLDAAPGNGNWHVWWNDVFLTEGLHEIELRAREFGGGENSDLDWLTPFSGWQGVPTSAFVVDLYEGAVRTLLYGTDAIGLAGLEDLAWSHGGYDIYDFRFTVNVAGLEAVATDFYRSPEPTTLSLLALGGLALLRRRRHRKMNSNWKTLTAALALALILGSSAASAAIVGVDIGSTQPGSTTEAPPGTYTIVANGSDIYGNSDNFHYAYETTAVNGDFISAARLVSQENTDSWAKAGLMMRDGTAANAIHVFTAATPGNGIVQQRRDSTGGGSSGSSFSSDPNSVWGPLWLSLERSGNDFHSRWTLDYYGQPLVWSDPLTHTSTNMPASANIGMAATSHDGGTTGTNVFDNVQLTGATLTPPVAVPAPWVSEDIGGPAQAGSAEYLTATQTFHVDGGGADVWGTSDEFHFVHQPEGGDFSAVAQVFWQENTNGWAKAGWMARNGTADDAAYVASRSTPGNGVGMQWRDNGGSGSGSGNISGSPDTTAGPHWVYLSRDGDTFTARWAPDDGGVPGFWQNTVSHTNGNVGATPELGLYVTSHNAGALSNVVFGGVQVGNWQAIGEIHANSGVLYGKARGQDVDTGSLLSGPAHWKVETLTPNIANAPEGLRTEWFDNGGFSGTPIADFRSDEINWTSGNYPAETGWSGNHDNFSVRYTGLFYVPDAGTYTFEESVDDEAWLSIDGTQVLHNNQWNVDTTVAIDLLQGWHGIEFRSREGGGGDFARLRWDPDGEGLRVMTEDDALFRDMLFGSLTPDQLVAEGYGDVGDLLSTDWFAGAILPNFKPYSVRLTVDYFGETAQITEVFMGSPEPGTLSLLALGGMGALLRRRRQRRAVQN
jgi:hypothetical protein